MSRPHAEVAVVGAGIVGLAHAWAAARRGLSVLLFERSPRPSGASVRGFGMIWPIGQAGDLYFQAMRSRDRWIELSQKAGVWVNDCGSLHLATGPDEKAVLEEFQARAGGAVGGGIACELLTPRQAVFMCGNHAGRSSSRKSLCLNLSFDDGPEPAPGAGLGGMRR